MRGYQYQHGDRPLEGYTIQHAAGRGGFGEVYYAVSDAGREVALKAIQGYEQIELRGISQCMNLKSPHLVSIFDVRHNDAGQPFVIMEFVAGPSLRELIDKSPAGLGTQKAAFFLRELAKGLGYLHDCGIVHRDLKPGNVFYEDGYVKIGDYGLSKAMTAGAHSGQTITVGTVHYMAPEIGQGRYDRSIDIYAMGCILYEMLTGQTPFFGSSTGEVLMKHITAEADVSHIEEPFARVIKKALSKNPADRYATVQEMVEDVFGAEHVRDSVSAFSPNDLSMIAGKVARKVRGDASAEGDDASNQARGPSSRQQSPGASDGATPPPPPGGQGSQAAEQWAQRGAQLGEKLGRWGAHVGERMGRWGCELGEKIASEVSSKGEKCGWPRKNTRPQLPVAAPSTPPDTLSTTHRRLLSVVTIGTICIGATILSSAGHKPGLVGIIACMMALGATFGVRLAGAKFRPRIEHEGTFVKRLAYGGLAAIFAVLFSVIFTNGLGGRDFDSLAGTYLAVIIPLLFTSWDKITRPDRKERVKADHAFGVALAGWILGLIFDGSAILAGGILASVALAVQVASPWQPRLSRKSPPPVPGSERERRQAANDADDDDDDLVVDPADVATGAGSSPRRGSAASSPYTGPSVKPVHRFMPAFWMLLCLGALGVGLLMLIAPVTTGRIPDEVFVVAVSMGIGALMFAVFALVKSMQTHSVGWWRGIIKPFALMGCVQLIIMASLALGTIRLSAEETGAAFFLILFPGIVLIVLLSIPNRVFEGVFGDIQTGRSSIRSMADISPQQRWAALLMAMLWFFGAGGIHRFYVGKIFTGIVWVCTWGFFGIGQAIDVLNIVRGRFTDDQGRRLLIWHSRDELKYDARYSWLFSPDAQARADAEVAAERTLSDSQAGHMRKQARLSVFTALGSLLMAMGLLVGLSAAIDVPMMIASGLIDAQLAREAEQAFGFSEWPIVMTRMGFIAAAVTLLAALVMLVVARREHGIMHVLRAGVAIGAFIAAMPGLHQAIEATPWGAITSHVEVNQYGPALKVFLDAARPGPALAACLFFVTGIFMLAWPTKDQRADARSARESAKAAADGDERDALPGKTPSTVIDLDDESNRDDANSVAAAPPAREGA